VGQLYARILKHALRDVHAENNQPFSRFRPTVGTLLPTPNPFGSPFFWNSLEGSYSLSHSLHLAIQRKCIGDESDKAMSRSISNRHSIMGSKHYHEDSDLESTLGIIDRIFGDSEPMYWQNFTFTIPHHAWMGHILLCRAWDILGKAKPLPDGIKDFVLRSLRLGPPPPAPIVAGCLLTIGLVLGIKLRIGDLLVAYKR